MTRKDYVETARILADSRDSLLSLGLEGEQIFENLVSDFITMFQDDNERFIVSKFADACWRK
jgi:DNA-binding MarR family transcriptional regulator